MSTITANFTKHNDEWAIRVRGLAHEIANLQGREITVTKRSGDAKQITLGSPIRAYDAGTTMIYSSARQGQQAQDEPRTVGVTDPGVYENDEGIFIVKPNRAKTNLYAKRLVEINPERATESGERVQIDFEYAPGAIYNLRPEHKMDLDRAKALTVRYGRCIVCGHHLKAAESVERGIGPVCRKSFGSTSSATPAEDDAIVGRVEDSTITAARLTYERIDRQLRSSSSEQERDRLDSIRASVGKLIRDLEHGIEIPDIDGHLAEIEEAAQS